MVSKPVLAGSAIIVSLLILTSLVGAQSQEYWFWSDGTTPNLTQGVYSGVSLHNAMVDVGDYWLSSSGGGFIYVYADDPYLLGEYGPPYTGMELTWEYQYDVWPDSLGDWSRFRLKQNSSFSPVNDTYCTAPSCTLFDWNTVSGTATWTVDGSPPPSYSSILALYQVSQTGWRLRNVRWKLIAVNGEPVATPTPTPAPAAGGGSTLDITGLSDTDQIISYANLLLLALIPVTLIWIGFAVGRFVVNLAMRVWRVDW